MSRDELRDFLDQVQRAFFAGDVDALRQHFALPLVVYSAAGVVVRRTEKEFARLVEDYRDALLATSVVVGHQMIVARDPLVNNRCRATVRTTEVDADGQAVASALIRYFLVADSGSYLIEMMEYLEAPLPISEIERIIH